MLAEADETDRHFCGHLLFNLLLFFLNFFFSSLYMFAR